MVLIMPVPDLDAALTEANRLDVGLAAYGYTTSQRSALDLQNGLNAGVVGINNAGVSLPEAPFGGVDETGQGSEGGTEGIETFLRTKFVNELAV
jgi:succinate-semialdehyde dehydrogenase/glutarate-semialdehyde dehydrogenase